MRFILDSLVYLFRLAGLILIKQKSHLLTALCSIASWKSSLLCWTLHMFGQKLPDLKRRRCRGMGWVCHSSERANKVPLLKSQSVGLQNLWLFLNMWAFVYLWFGRLTNRPLLSSAPVSQKTSRGHGSVSALECVVLSQGSGFTAVRGDSSGMRSTRLFQCSHDSVEQKLLNVSFWHAFWS